MIGLLIFLASFTFSGSPSNEVKVNKDTQMLLGDPKKKPTRPKRMPSLPTYKTK